MPRNEAAKERLSLELGRAIGCRDFASCLILRELFEGGVFDEFGAAEGGQLDDVLSVCHR